MTSEDVRRIDVNVSASYDDAADKVRAALCAAAAAHEKTLRDRPVEAHVVSYGDSSIQYVLRFWARTEVIGRAITMCSTVQEVFSAARDHHVLSAYQCSYGIIKKGISGYRISFSA